MSEQVAAPDWIQGLADESIKSDPSLQSFKSVDDLAKSFISTKALVGKKGVLLPGEGAKDEDWGPVFNAIGRPEKPEGYQYRAPDGIKVNDEYLKEFRNHAHQMGMTQKQFERLVNMRIEHETNEQKAREAEITKFKQDGETALRKEWGAKYDEKMSVIQKAIKSFGGDLPQDPKEYDPRITRLIGQMAEHLSESTLGTLGVVKGNKLTPAEAEVEIATIRGNKEHPYNIANHPKHKEAVADVDRLYRMAHPDKKAI